MLGEIFELFYQNERTIHRVGGGMGVGLSLVKKIIDAHGGSVSVSSAGQGRGSEFTLMIPTTRQTTTQDRFTDLQSRNTRKVIVVEDVDDSRELLTALLERSGFDVVAFSDGETACQQIPIIDPDVAIIDIGLPVRNGFELAESLRELEASGTISKTTLIAVSGYAQINDRLRGEASGCYAHLPKPAQINEILESLDRTKQSSSP